MLEAASHMKNSMLGSALGGTSKLRPEGGKHRRTMVASLMLTSLVDAFSILVIFLIMNVGANQEALNVGDKVQLPQAQSTSLIQQGLVVRIEDGKFIVDEKPVAIGSLLAVFKKHNTGTEAAKKEGLVIVADKQLDYADLSPVILAGSSAGFTKFKFAVVKND
jgi:biopolymer transport protein ExbD